MTELKAWQGTEGKEGGVSLFTEPPDIVGRQGCWSLLLSPGHPPHRPHSRWAWKGIGLETTRGRTSMNFSLAVAATAVPCSVHHPPSPGPNVQRGPCRGAWLLVLSARKKMGPPATSSASQSLINNTGKMVSLQSGCEGCVT